MKALALKELRELRGIAALAVGVYLLLVARMMGLKVVEWLGDYTPDQENLPFLNGEFLGFFALLAAVFAMALGFRQTVWESRSGTFLFLLHRPISRRAVFLTKLITGALLFVACSALPILLYGFWAATPGNIASPFRWSWTLPTWAMIGVLLPVYVSAFLSGLRPARWFGTRLFPLAGAILVVTVTFSASYLVLFHHAGLILFIQVMTTVLLLSTGIAAICYVAQIRDYA